MEGKNEKVELGIQKVDVPIVETTEKIPEAIEEEPEEDYPEEYPEDYPEEYSEEISEEYPDDNWEEDTDSPEQAPLGGLYGLFKNVARQRDTKRVSNLTKEELGLWNLSVRDCERIALIAETFHHPGVARFFIKQSRIITDTAMSKSGWFTELFITSKKFATRDSSSSIENLPQFSKKSKWKIFSSKGNQQMQEPM